MPSHSGWEGDCEGILLGQQISGAPTWLTSLVAPFHSSLFPVELSDPFECFLLPEPATLVSHSFKTAAEVRAVSFSEDSENLMGRNTILGGVWRGEMVVGLT